MTDTDRKKIKDQQWGTYTTTAGISNAETAVRGQHSRTRDYQHRGAENAITNVAAVPVLASIDRKSKLRSVGIAVTTAIAANATDYAHVKFYKRLAGTSTLIASWNTHTSAQGALVTSSTAQIVAAAGLVTNADSEIADGSAVTMVISKYGAGKDVDIGTCFSFDLEEI